MIKSVMANSAAGLEHPKDSNLRIPVVAMVNAAGLDAASGTHNYVYNGSSQVLLDTWAVGESVFVKAYTWTGSVKTSESDWGEIRVSGTGTAGSVLTAAFLQGTGTVQWTRTPILGGVTADIANANALTYQVATIDRGYTITPRATSYQPSVAGKAVPVVAPLAPTITAFESAGADSVKVTFTRNADNGGATVTGDRARIYNAGNDLLMAEANGTSPITVTGLPQITLYARVASINSQGVGDFSANSLPATPTAAGSTTYTRFKTAMAAVAAATGYCRVGLLGDSTTGGARALGPAANAVRTESPVVYLKDRFNAVQARPTIASSWVGDQSFGVTNTLSPYAYDTRMTSPDGVGWTYTSPSPRTVAGSMMFNPANDTKRFGFLPEVPVDTIDVYYPLNTTLGAFTLARVGGSTVPVSQVGTNGTQKATFTGTLNSVDPLYAQRTSSTGSAYIYAMDAYNSAIKSVRLYGMGWSGGKVADWILTVNGFDPLPALLSLNLDLVFIRPGINDAVAGTAPATFKAQLVTLVDALLAAGTNVVLATQYPSNVASASQAVQNALAQQVRDVASERGLALQDTHAEWVDWTTANSLGDMADNLHANKQGLTKSVVKTADLLIGLAA